MFSIRELNLIPQCEELYSKIDPLKNLLSVKRSDIDAYNKSVEKKSHKRKTKDAKKNEPTHTSKTSKNKSVVVRHDDQNRINRHSFRRHAHDGMGLGSSGVGSETLQQLQEMQNGSDLSPSPKKNRPRGKVSKNPPKKISRRVINDDESTIKSNKRNKPHFKKVRTNTEQGHESHVRERQGQDPHDRIKKSIIKKKAIKNVVSKRESGLSKKKSITKNESKHDDSDGAYEKQRRRKNDDGVGKKNKQKRKKVNDSDDEKEENPEPKRNRNNEKAKNTKKKKGKGN